MNLTPEDALLEVIFLCDFGPGLDIASTIVDADDFILDFNRRMWKAMVAVHGRGEPLDCSCLCAQLMRDGMKQDDAVNLLTRTMDGAPLKGFAEMYAKRVREASRQHKIAKAVELAELRIKEGEDVVWVKDELAVEMAEIEGQHADRDWPLAEVMPTTMQVMADQLNGDESKQALPTGIADLDLMTVGGIRQDELWIVGGMPGRGKTAFGLQVAHSLTGRGVPVYFVSLEMSRAAISRRLLKMKFGAATLVNPGDQWQAMNDYAVDLGTLPLYINEGAALTASEVVGRCRVAIHRHGIRLIVVDYLQLVRMEKGTDRREAVGDACNQLRALAKQTHVPIMLLSQLRRPQSLNDRPTMIDLKESGDLEAHAHVVLLLYMPTEKGAPIGEEEIIIGKQREGATGTVEVFFEGSRGKFHLRERS